MLLIAHYNRQLASFYFNLQHSTYKFRLQHPWIAHVCIAGLFLFQTQHGLFQFVNTKLSIFCIAREQALSLLPRDQPASRLFCSALMAFPNRALPKKSSTIAFATGQTPLGSRIFFLEWNDKRGKEKSRLRGSTNEILYELKRNFRKPAFSFRAVL